jgi:hypothetical protein
LDRLSEDPGFESVHPLMMYGVLLFFQSKSYLLYGL